jgi:hypothetical protein
MILEEPKELIEPLFERVRDYGKTSFELVKLKAIDKGSELAANVISAVIMAVVFGLFFLMANIGLALWLGELLGAVHYGFFLVAGIYLLAWFGTLAAKSLIKRKIADSIVEKIMENQTQ